jgi:hypothetical protein
LSNGAWSARIWSVRYSLDGVSVTVMLESLKSACEPWNGTCGKTSIEPPWIASTIGGVSAKYLIWTPSRYGRPWPQ